MKLVALLLALIAPWANAARLYMYTDLACSTGEADSGMEVFAGEGDCETSYYIPYTSSGEAWQHMSYTCTAATGAVEESTWEDSCSGLEQCTCSGSPDETYTISPSHWPEVCNLFGGGRRRASIVAQAWEDFVHEDIYCCSGVRRAEGERTS